MSMTEAKLTKPTKSILCRMPAILQPVILQYLNMREFESGPLLNLSRYHRATWIHSYWCGQSTRRIIFSPETVVRNTAPQILWYIMLQMHFWGKQQYIAKVLMPIILSRSDQDEVWNFEIHSDIWLGFEGYQVYEGHAILKEIICTHIPTQFIPYFAARLLEEGEYRWLLNIVKVRQHIRAWHTLLPIFEGTNDIEQHIGQIYETFSCDGLKESLYLLEALEIYGKPYRVNKYDMYNIAQLPIDKTSDTIKIIIQHYLDDDTSGVNAFAGFDLWGVPECLYSVCMLLKDKWPIWVASAMDYFFEPSPPLERDWDSESD